ncbi:MAG: hypothetical protein ABJB16_11290 [Saprospiraceae bacterium]
MQKNNKNIFKEEISMNNNQSSYWMRVLNISILLIGLILLIGGMGCNSKPKETEVVPPYFTINGTELKVDVVGIPKDSLNKDIYQAVVNTAVNFEGPAAVSPDVNQWIVDGKVIKSGKNQFTYTFELPGLYQVKHCHGTEICATRFVNVTAPVVFSEEEEHAEKIQPPIPKEKVNHLNQIKEEEKVRVEIPSKQKEPTTNPTPKAPNELIDPAGQSSSEVARASKPPEVYKSSMITGLPSSSYKSDCASWVETASIRLVIKDWCELHSAAVYGSGSGKLKIQLTNGNKVNETMIVTLNPGKTNFSFAGLDAELQPGMEYTLRITTMSDGKGDKPKIGNISKCGSANGSTSSVLSIDYGSNLTLFDLKYKY